MSLTQIPHTQTKSCWHGASGGQPCTCIRAHNAHQRACMTHMLCTVWVQGVNVLQSVGFFFVRDDEETPQVRKS